MAGHLCPSMECAMNGHRMAPVTSAFSDPYGNGGILPAGTGETGGETDEPEPMERAEYTCGPCLRDRHRDCRTAECGCCEGDG